MREEIPAGRRRRSRIQVLAVVSVLCSLSSCSRGDDAQAQPSVETTAPVAAATRAERANERFPLENVRGPLVVTPEKLVDLRQKLDPKVLYRVEHFQTSSAIGGKSVTTSGEYPWAAVLTMDADGQRIPFCSAALIRPQWLLTAAHCLLDIPSGGGAYVGGTHFINDPGQYRAIVQLVPHPQFNADTKQNDIALLKLASPVSFATMLLIKSGETIDTAPRAALFLGWGAQGGGNTAVEQLQELDAPLVTQSVCASQYQTTLTGQMLCAGHLGGTTCQGDSGGPLMVEDGGEWVGVGAASFNSSCMKPGVFARVSSYATWIDSVL